jgi:hypothetical protein
MKLDFNSFWGGRAVINDILRPTENLTLNEKYPSTLHSSTAKQKVGFSYYSVHVLLCMVILFYRWWATSSFNNSCYCTTHCWASKKCHTAKVVCVCGRLAKDSWCNQSPIHTNHLGQISHNSLKLLNSKCEEPASQYEYWQAHKGISSFVAYIC